TSSSLRSTTTRNRTPPSVMASSRSRTSSCSKTARRRRKRSVHSRRALSSAHSVWQRRKSRPMKDIWHIRLARAADYDTLVELWERSVRATHDFLTEDDIGALRPLVGAALSDDALELRVLPS